MTQPIEVPQELIDEFKLLTGSVKDNDAIAQMLFDYRDDDGTYNVNRAVAQEWRYTAAGYARLVDVTESGSSRKMSDLHKNALTMVAQFTNLAGDVAIVESAPRGARTRAIVRE